MIRIAEFEELCAEVQRLQADRAIADERVSRAVHTEHGGEMAGGGVVNRLWEKHRAGGVRTLFHNLLVETPRVLHPAARYAEHDGEPRFLRGRELAAAVSERGFPRRRCEQTDRARTPQARLATEVRGVFRWHRSRAELATCFGICDFDDCRSFACFDATPDRIEIATERRDAADTSDVHTHPLTSSMTTLAFVPPKPNEFDTTQPTRASRAAFATMFNSHAGSGSR